MGVKGLWRLLLPIGRRISIETLAGKTLAIDASIWLTQFLKAMRDAETGKVMAAAHLIGFVRRLCRLRFHNIKPVLVFDGATPEIKKREILQRRKRREQFAKLTDGSVQRLAKKILAEKLLAAAKKSKKSSGALAPGFDPGEQEVQRHEKKKPPPLAENTTLNEDSEPAAAAAAAVANGGSQEDPEVEILSPQSNHQHQQEVSDWDLPLAVAAAEEAKEMDDDDDESSDNDNVEYDTLNDFSPDVISVEQISSLPASQRKDAIEKAKRQQRLQARKEFMPAAANPIDFSQVQLQNFLKSCKLNKDIETMAKTAAARDNMGLAGEVMASDRTTRIELLREEEEEGTNNNDASNGGGGGPVCSLKAKLMSKKQARRRVVAKASDNNSSDEESWGEGNNATVPTNKRRFLEDDDESSNESVKEIAVRASTGRVYVRETIQLDDDSSDNEQSGVGFVPAFADRNKFRRSTIRANNDGDSSDDNEGGGFLKPNVLDKADQTAIIATRVAKQKIDRQQLSSDARYAQEMEDHAIAQVLQEDEDANESPDSHFCFQQQERRDAFSSTGLEDSMLAQALQAQETGGVSLKRKDVRESDSKKVASDVRHTAFGEESGTNMTATKNGAVKACGSSDSGDDVDWEDGASPARNKSGSARTNKTISLMAATKEVTGVDDEKESSDGSEDELDWDDGDASAEHENSRQKTSAQGSSSLAIDADEIATGVFSTNEKSNNVTDSGATEPCGSSDTDDDVDWQDGANSTSSMDRSSKLMAATKEVIEVDNEKEDSEGSEDELDWEDGDAPVEHNPKQKTCVQGSDRLDVGVDEIETGFYSTNDYDSSVLGHQFEKSAWGKGRHLNNPMSSETSAALLQAQATAANLTNWAGRAFRRAIQEAGGSESPSKKTTKPISLTDGMHESEGGDRSVQQTADFPTLLERAEGSLSEEEHERLDDSLPSDQQPTPIAAPADVSTAAPFDVSFLRENEYQWTAERNKRERDIDTVSDEMLEEAKELLQLFGVPYIEAPAEAEAQCAALEQLGLVDGIVTEDSDVFVFDGHTVYKNIFDEQKYAEVYRAEDAEREMRIGRNAMVALAMMLGSDYTEGIRGVGIVNAMEILDTFDVSEDLKGGLSSFKKWLDGFDPSDFGGKPTEHATMTKEQQFHSKHKSARARWIAPPNFPADNVIKAYMDPVVDKSTERFSWGVPDVEKLILFFNRHIGWSPEETERILDPVVKELGKGLRQTRIDSFMRYEDSIKFADVRSKRLRDVLGLKGGTDDTSDESCHAEDKSRKKKRI